MDQLREWGVILSNSLNDFVLAIANLLPRLFGAIVLFVVGWLLARVLRGLTLKLIQFLDRLLQRFALTSTAEYKRLKQTTGTALSALIFWMVILVFIAASANVLQVEIFTRWFDALLLYLPKLLAGAVIIFSGAIFGSGVQSFVAHAAISARLHQAELIGRIAQFAIVISAFVVGVGQLGIDITFLTNLAVVGFGVILGAFGLGIALATPAHISNIISVHSIRRHYQEGDEIQIGLHQGRILAITQNMVIIETAQGETSIPARLFIDQPAAKLIAKVENE